MLQPYDSDIHLKPTLLATAFHVIGKQKNEEKKQTNKQASGTRMPPRRITSASSHCYSHDLYHSGFILQLQSMARRLPRFPAALMSPVVFRGIAAVL